MEDMVDVIVNYGGQIGNKPCKHYRGGFKTSIPTDADKLDVRTIIEDYPKLFDYHQDSKAYYKVNGESFFGGLKEVRSDADITKMTSNAHKNPKRLIEIFVDHMLPKDHPDYGSNREKVKNMKRIDIVVDKQGSDENGPGNWNDDSDMSGRELSDPEINDDDREISGEDLYGQEKMANKGEAYEKKRRDRIKENQEMLRSIGLGGVQKKVSKKENKKQNQNSTNFSDQTPINDKSGVFQVGAVRRSLRNVMTDGDARSNEVPFTQSRENAEPNTVDGSSGVGAEQTKEVTNRTRGLTRGLKLARKRKLGETMDIVITEDRRRIVGNNAQDFITEAGCVVRQIAPLLGGTWKKIPAEKKNQMWEILMNKFSLPDNTLTKEVVYKQLGNQYRNYRNRLHKYHFLPHGKVEKAVKHCPPGIDSNEWAELCKVFDGDEFKKRSEINKANRSKQTSTHGNGSMGFARREFELTNELTNERPKMSDLWKKTHWSKTKKDWVSEYARNVHDEADEKIKALQLEGLEVDEDQVYAEILGKEKNYIRGPGSGPRRASRNEVNRLLEEKQQELASVKEVATKEAEEARKEAEEARKEAEEARKEAEEAKKEAQQANMMITEMIKKQDDMSNQLNKMLLLVSNMGQKNPSSPKKKRKGGA